MLRNFVLVPLLVDIYTCNHFPASATKTAGFKNQKSFESTLQFQDKKSLPKLPVVLHRAVAKVSRIGKLWERLVVVSHGWQSKNTDGSNCLTAEVIN